MNRKIAIIGDLIVDKYKYFKATRLSPEGPAPIVKKESEEIIAGGAGNVAISLSNLFDGIDFYFAFSEKQKNISLNLIKSLFEDTSVNLNLISSEKEFIIPLKTRYYVDNHNFMREDNEEKFLSQYSAIKREFIIKIVQDYELIILSDYQKGFISPENLEFLIKLCNEKSIPLFIDTKIKNFRIFKNAFCLKINITEFNNLFSNYLISDKEDIDCIKDKISQARVESNIKNLVVTLGDKGSVASSKEDTYFAVANKVEMVDITGAGDAFVSALVFSFYRDLKKYKFDELNLLNLNHLIFANSAAGFVVSHKGTVPIPKEFKIESSEKKLKVGFTNGCFDILHPGHLSLLSQAKDTCDYLTVGLNSDKSVKKLKGNSRPINKQEIRKQMLLALKYVDDVIIFDEDTPLNLIKELSPDVLIKGEDYEMDQIIGKDYVLSTGGKIIRAKLVSEMSTTNIIKNIKKI